MSFCSWSGGKDCCLALYKAKRAGLDPKVLLTMMCAEFKGRSRSHGLSVEVLMAQSEALRTPILLQDSTWNEYKNDFIRRLRKIKVSHPDVTTGIFGDIDSEEQRQWEEEVCTEIGFEAFLPLWKEDRKNILKEFLTAGFKAVIVSVQEGILEPHFLGRTIDKALIEEFEKSGIDSCGENGEYHSVVVDGPLFDESLELVKEGGSVLKSGYWFQDFTVFIPTPPLTPSS